MVGRIREAERCRKREGKREEDGGGGRTERKAQERIIEQTFPRHLVSTGHCLMNAASFGPQKAL